MLEDEEEDEEDEEENEDDEDNDCSIIFIFPPKNFPLRIRFVLINSSGILGNNIYP